MISLLLDANLSPETSAFLRDLGLDVTDLSTRRLADHTIEAVNAVLGQFIVSITPSVDLATSCLMVIDEHRARIITYRAKWRKPQLAG